MFQVGERKRTRRTLEVDKPTSRRRLSVKSIGENAPLRGAVVCLTGFPSNEKARLHRCVEELGGRYFLSNVCCHVYHSTWQQLNLPDSIPSFPFFVYSFIRDLDTAKTTHLIAKDPEGAKYDTAIACPTIRVVSPTWLEECVKTGKREDERLHSLTVVADNSHNFPPLEQEIEQHLQCNGRNDLFVSCRFLLLGFNDDSDVKLGRLIRRGKGTIYWELNEMITHIIVANDCDESRR